MPDRESDAVQSPDAPGEHDAIDDENSALPPVEDDDMTFAEATEVGEEPELAADSDED